MQSPHCVFYKWAEPNLAAVQHKGNRGIVYRVLLLTIYLNYLFYKYLLVQIFCALYKNEWKFYLRACTLAIC